jgi:hypothetical protein
MKNCSLGYEKDLFYTLGKEKAKLGAGRANRTIGDR